MPVFAFANAGVNLEGLTLSSLMTPVPLGILCGLFFGKQIGVLLFSYVSIKLNFAESPNNSNWISLYGVSILTGIGFTMSLFVGNLAFVENTQHIDGVKIGVLTGSLLSTVFGYFLLLISSKK
jgi:NhaA family Na+:H+ antiporter